MGFVLDNIAIISNENGDSIIQLENITPLIIARNIEVDILENVQEVHNEVGIEGIEQENDQENIQRTIIIESNDVDNITPEPENEVEISLNSEGNEIPTDNYMQLDNSVTKKGDIRKRKKYLVPKNGRMEFLQKKRVESHEVKPPCKCKKQCFNKIGQQTRQKINRKYWSKTFTERKAFVSHHTEILNVTKRRSSSTENFKKMATRKYFLKEDNGTHLQVCKVFFLTTLGYAGNNDTILRNIESPPKDKRGSYKRKLKIDKEIIQNHIKKYSPCVSHYRREHAPHKLYLPSDITINMMFQDFKETHSNITISYEYYRSVIKYMNISFAKLGHEECEKCEAFLLHDVTHSKENAAANNDCLTCCQWLQHIRKAEISREEYRSDKHKSYDETIIHYSTDMQKVIMLPRLEMFKQVLFTPRIIAFNQSFVPLGNISIKNKAVAVLWNEAISGRKKEDLISAYYAFLTNYARDKKHIFIWADNCSGQNKNWSLLSFLIYIINSDHIAAETITIKYFEVGHTFMSADSFHHLVEKGLKETPKVYDFQDFENVVQNSTKNNGVSVKTMKFSDFKHWPNFATNYHIQKLNKNRPLLKDIVLIEGRRGSRNLFYKSCFKELEYQELHVISKKNFVFKEPESHTSDRGITSERKHKLLNNLSSIFPKHKLSFWENLPESTALDLINNIEDQ